MEKMGKRCRAYQRLIVSSDYHLIAELLMREHLEQPSLDAAVDMAIRLVKHHQKHIPFGFRLVVHIQEYLYHL